MSTSYDVVIVGAGPAGSLTARYAAQGGLQTLLLDKKNLIGEPVRCGEFTPAVNELRIFFPRAQELEEIFTFPKNLIAQDISSVRVFSPYGKVYEFPIQGYTVERKWFDKYLVEEAKKAGAIIKTGEKVVRLEENKVITEKGTYETKVIIGADGPSSLVAHFAGLPKNKEYALSAQYEMGDLKIDPSVMEMYAGKIAPGAYAWIIPKGEQRANVGVGIRRRFSGKESVIKLLKYFINHSPASRKVAQGKPLSFVTGLVPTGGPLPQTVKDNLLLVGDAAGQVLPITGGGIPTAMICGRIAGQVCVEYFHSSLPLHEYEKRWREELGAGFFRIWYLGKKLEWICHFDWGLELFIRILGDKGIEKAIKLQF